VLIMVGLVRTRDLFIHSSLILHEFGVACFARCLRRALISRRPVTFLECLTWSR
jgi:hypothetical protein